MSSSNEINPLMSATFSESISNSERWPDGIAIIGMSARFPQSRNVQEFWQHLVAGDSLIVNFSEDELHQAGIDQAMLRDANYVRRGNVIEDADQFDAGFFGLSRREAEILDPQQRIFLECAWEALENAGHTGEGERVGVFAGVGMNTYVLQLLRNPGVLASVGEYQMMLASDKDYLATRVAYKLDLRGPAVTVQTACSTSLAAVHLACRSLLSRECSMALAGGVSISFPQGIGYSYIPGMILSPDGHCRPFDANAEGTVPGRGAGIVVLKRLSEAIADGDSIIAVIRGSAWNNDGAGKVGYTAPSVDGQTEVIRAAQAAAGIDGARVGYVETHGTATELGDAIEFSALTQVFATEERKHPLVLSAVKANMGHADAAAGIAGLIKAALAVDTGIIPPTPGFEIPNPALGIEKTPFVISSSSLDWAGDAERWAGVSSFGIGGTNVHVVLSAAPAAASSNAEPVRSHIFPVSAKSASALSTACEQLSQRLAAESDLSASDVATTLQLGRRSFGFRRAVVADNCSEAAKLLIKPARKLEPGTHLDRDVIFLFPGQGQQFPGMVEDLYRKDSVFRRTIDAGCDFLKEYAELDVRSLLVNGERTSESSTRLRDTQVAQPVLMLVEYALAERLRSLGVEPAGLLGHSIGELTAACVAGVFSFEDGLRLAVERGRLMAQTPPGIMLAVMLPPEDLARYLDHGLWLAAENGPKMSVASGLVDAVEELERRLAVERVATIRLASKNAFHTPLMAEPAKTFRGIVAATVRHAPSIPWVSNVSGGWIGLAEAQDPQYWANQIISPVRFTRCLATLAERRRLLIEAGPGEALIGIARQQLSTSVLIPVLGADNRRATDGVIFHQAVATAWECGVNIQWERLSPKPAGRRVPLPTYPFERQRYWVEPASSVNETAVSTATPLLSPLPASDSDSPAKHEDISKWFYAPCWQGTPPAGNVLRARSKSVECWLALDGEDPLSNALVSSLRAQGSKVICVKAGEQFHWQDGDVRVNPSSPADLKTLWEQIEAAGLRPDGLLCLPRSGLEGNKGSRYDFILQLLQMAGTRQRYLRRFEFITNSLVSVNGEPVTNREDGELLGLARALRAELVGVECRSIDIELPEGNVEPLVQNVLDELSTSGPGLSIAYRRGQRWQKIWTQAALKADAKSPFRSGGVYLITGGVGGIGYVAAKHLLQDHGARVVVVGRTILPDRSEWESWVSAHGEDHATSRRIRRMQELEGAGGEVLFMAADVADRDAMKAVIDQTQAKFGPIHGVIHSAGVAGGSRILSQPVEEAREIRKPKIEGSRVLAELLRDSGIDFLLFCSSISANFPPASQSAYSSANAFQNSFAEYCRGSLKIPAFAIGFDAWREVGMMAELVLPEGMESFREQGMRRAMTNAEGIEVISRVLGQWRGAHILVSTCDLDASVNSTTPAAVELPDSDDAVSAVIDSSELSVILEIWKDLLGTDAIDPSDNFFNLGGHSLMATMMISRIRERLGVTLSLKGIFEAQTPAALAELVQIVSGQPAAGEHSEAPTEGEEREIFEI
ncbi:type I polyketide synthase [Terracidiphilus gabretensis]|uniref:type I polyketide synthase n=1 Tax=Terracidiphilus gabretensis TaxID=1577687 RepID=UPI00071B8865|nr:type I polyketide synthase [Terracidiphilus gabretensis]